LGRDRGHRNIVLWYGARLALQGQLTPGALVVFCSTSQDVQPMRDLSKMTDHRLERDWAERIRS